VPPEPFTRGSPDVACLLPPARPAQAALVADPENPVDRGRQLSVRRQVPGPSSPAESWSAGLLIAFTDPKAVPGHAFEQPSSPPPGNAIAHAWDSAAGRLWADWVSRGFDLQPAYGRPRSSAEVDRDRFSSDGTVSQGLQPACPRQRGERHSADLSRAVSVALAFPPGLFQHPRAEPSSSAARESVGRLAFGFGVHPARPFIPRRGQRGSAPSSGGAPGLGWSARFKGVYRAHEGDRDDHANYVMASLSCPGLLGLGGPAVRPDGTWSARPPSRSTRPPPPAAGSRTCRVTPAFPLARHRLLGRVWWL